MRTENIRINMNAIFCLCPEYSEPMPFDLKPNESSEFITFTSKLLSLIYFIDWSFVDRNGNKIREAKPYYQRMLPLTCISSIDSVQ